MTAEIQSFRRVLIVADESADWMVAGLRQLERLALSIDEFAVENNETAPVLVSIFWRPDLDKSQRWTPGNPRLTKVAFTRAPIPLPKGRAVLDGGIGLAAQDNFRRRGQGVLGEQFPASGGIASLPGKSLGIYHRWEPDRRDRKKVPAWQRQVPGRFRLSIFESSNFARGDAPSPEIPHHSEWMDLVDLSDSHRRIAHPSARDLFVISIGSGAYSGFQCP